MLTFSTGAPLPQTTLKGQVVDWSTSRPAPGALVVASLLPDSLPYRGVADSSGRFSLGPLPAGDYLVSGVMDQNRDTGRIRARLSTAPGCARARPTVGELWAFVHDTSAAPDPVASPSTTASPPRSRSPRSSTLGSGSRRETCSLRLLPDSTPVAVSSILPQPVDDSLHADAQRRRDTDRGDAIPSRSDTGARSRSDAPGVSARRRRGRSRRRPPLYDRLVLRSAGPGRLALATCWRFAACGT